MYAGFRVGMYTCTHIDTWKYMYQQDICADSCRIQIRRETRATNRWILYTLTLTCTYIRTRTFMCRRFGRSHAGFRIDVKLALETYPCSIHTDSHVRIYLRTHIPAGYLCGFMPDVDFIWDSRLPVSRQLLISNLLVSNTRIRTCIYIHVHTCNARYLCGFKPDSNLTLDLRQILSDVIHANILTYWYYIYTHTHLNLFILQVHTCSHVDISIRHICMQDICADSCQIQNRYGICARSGRQLTNHRMPKRSSFLSNFIAQSRWWYANTYANIYMQIYVCKNMWAYMQIFMRVLSWCFTTCPKGGVYILFHSTEQVKYINMSAHVCANVNADIYANGYVNECARRGLTHDHMPNRSCVITYFTPRSKKLQHAATRCDTL